MRKAACIGSLAIAMTAATATPAHAAGMCSHRIKGMPVWVTLYGPDNGPTFCRLANKFGPRDDFFPLVAPSCTFRMNGGLQVYADIRARNRTLGRAVCALFQRNLRGSWTRVG